MINQRQRSHGSGRENPFRKVLVDSLNGLRDFEGELEIYRSLCGQDDPDSGAAAGRLVAELRRLVDAWLRSGKGAGGVDIPEKRKLEPKELFRSYEEWLLSNPFTPVLKTSGEVEWQKKRAPKHWKGMVNFSIDEARMLFFQLMSHPAKFALFKCSHPKCEIYYLLDKPRGMYKRGSFCPMHRRQQGALRQRKQSHAEAVRVAAKAMAAWPGLSASTRSRYKREKDYIASKLRRFGIGAKWVTRNLTEISNREVSTHA